MIIIHYAAYTLIVPSTSEEGMKACVTLDNYGYMRWFHLKNERINTQKLDKPRNELTISECIDLWESVWEHKQYSCNVYTQKR